MARELVFVPQELHLLAHFELETIKDILIIAGARKNNNTPTHSRFSVLSAEF